MSVSGVGTGAAQAAGASQVGTASAAPAEAGWP